MDQSAISDRERGATRIPDEQYAQWDQWLGCAAGALARRADACRKSVEVEQRLAAMAEAQSAERRAMAVIRTVLGEIAPAVADICEHASDTARESMLARLLAYAEGLAEEARRRGGSPRPEIGTIGGTDVPDGHAQQLGQA